jgi:hypothetical protein
VPIPGANASSYTIPVVATTDTAAQFSVIVGAPGIVKTSSVATLTVTADTRKPLIARVTGTESRDSINVRFSEPVTAPSATTAANYTLSGGANVTGATLVDPFNVRLATSVQTEGTVYTLTVNNVADNAGNAIETNSVVNYKAWGLVPGRARMDIWDGLTGTALDELFNDPTFPATPDRTIYTPGMNTPDGTGDNYGASVKGYFIPAESGSYNFFLRSDDASQLYLSTNDQFPTTLPGTWIAEELGCCSAFLEPNDATKPTVTTATPINVTAGTRYAMQALLKEGGGGDYVQVAKRKVGDTTPAGSLTPLSGDIYWFGPDNNQLATNNAITPTSANSPAAEQAPNVLDGNPETKYLNFDKLNTGFTVTPAGATTIRGIALTSANDAPERDPASFKIEGSVNGTSFTTIAEGPVSVFPARFLRREFYFDNSTAYTSYRVTFPTVANASNANSMQIADVELLGYPGGTLAAAPQEHEVSIGRNAQGQIVITFEGSLESTDNLSTPTWAPVTGTSPLTVTPDGTAKYYRSKK